MTAGELALVSSGSFLVFGMITGVWKYRHIMASPDAAAPVYVDIAHRTALLYSFACLVLFAMAERSAWSNAVDTAAVAASVLFFAAAVASYVLHGILRDTDNQLRRPHRLGGGTIPDAAIAAFMGALIVAEIGGALVLFSGMLVGMGFAG